MSQLQVIDTLTNLEFDDILVLDIDTSMDI